MAFMEAAVDGLTAGGRRIVALSMVLSYRYVDGYRAGHVSNLIRRYTERLDRRRIPHAYLWVLEAQGRGAPHVHLVLLVPYRTQLPWPSHIPKRGVMPWAHGWSSWERTDNIDGIVNYLCKAATKSELPKGARLFGVGGVDSGWKRSAKWHALPRWLRQRTEFGESLRPAPGGGYYSVETGEIYRTPWKFTLERVGGGHLVPVFSLADLTYEELRTIHAQVRCAARAAAAQPHR